MDTLAQLNEQKQQTINISALLNQANTTIMEMQEQLKNKDEEIRKTKQEAEEQNFQKSRSRQYTHRNYNQVTRQKTKILQ